MDNIELVLKLLIVGMVSVFAVLVIVIYLGKLLIVLVNKYFPEEQEPEKAIVNNAMDEKHRKAIEMAVATLTNGKARVEKIEKA